MAYLYKPSGSGGGVQYWNRISTTLTPATAGDVLLVDKYRLSGNTAVEIDKNVSGDIWLFVTDPTGSYPNSGMLLNSTTGAVDYKFNDVVYNSILLSAPKIIIGSSSASQESQLSMYDSNGNEYYFKTDANYNRLEIEGNLYFKQDFAKSYESYELQFYPSGGKIYGGVGEELVLEGVVYILPSLNTIHFGKNTNSYSIIDLTFDSSSGTGSYFRYDFSTAQMRYNEPLKVYGNNNVVMDSSVALQVGGDLDYKDKGFLPPVLTNAEIQAITNPVNGLQAYSSDWDMLMIYDSTRGKWLSSEVTALQYGENGIVDGAFLRFGGDMRDGGSGARMPFNGTIVRVTVQTSGGNATKGFEIRVNNTVVDTFNLSSNVYTATDKNVDFNAGDYISVYVSSAGASISNPSCIIWVKWRL